MKRTSRILAILLTLCVLCSTIALVGTAKETADHTGMPKATDAVKLNDFEDKTGEKELVSDEFVILRWYDAKEDGKLIKVTTLPVAVTPNFGSETIKYVDFETGILTEASVSGWLWDIDGDGNEYINLPEEPISALSETEFQIVLQESDGIIDVYPAKDLTPVDVGKLAYVVETTDTTGRVPFFPNDKYDDCFKDEITAEISKNLPKNAILHLYSDVNVADVIKVEQGGSLKVELNNHNITASNKLFDLDDGASLEIISTEWSTISAETFISVNEAFLNNLKINVSSAEAKINIESETLIDIYSVNADSDGITNEINFKNVVAAGKIDLTAPEVFLTVTDSAIGTKDGEDTLFVLNTVGSASITVSNSELYAGLIADGGSDDYILAIDNTLVNGDIKDSFLGNLLLGNCVKIGFDVRCGIDISYQSGVIAAVSNTLIKPEYIPEFMATLTTLLNSELNLGDVTPVIWKDALGATFKSDLYYKDALNSVAHPSNFEDKNKFPIATDFDNGWYNFSYDNWTPATEGTELNLLRPGVENVFTPTASMPTAAVTLMANVNLSTTVPTFTLYFKMPGAEVENVSFSIGEATLAFSSVFNHEIAGDTLVVEVPMELSSFDTIPLTVNFTVNGKAVFDEISVDFLTYAETVAEVYACGTKDNSLVFDLVRYKYEAYVQSVGLSNVDKELEKRIEKLFAAHNDEGCRCVRTLEDIQFAESELSAILPENVLSAEFDFEGARPTLYFYVPTSISVNSFDIKFVGLLHKVSGWDYINYKINETLTVCGTETIDGVECNVYKYDTLLCNAAAVFNITLKTDTGISAGSFSLASYAEALALENNSLATLAKAMYAASKSAYEFRTVGSDK